MGGGVEVITPRALLDRLNASDRQVTLYVAEESDSDLG